MNLKSSSIMKKTDSTTDTKFDKNVTGKGITWNQVKKLFNLLDDESRPFDCFIDKYNAEERGREVKLLIRGEDKEYFESLLDKLKDY